MRHLVQTFFDGSTGDAVNGAAGTDVSRLSSDEWNARVLSPRPAGNALITFDSFSTPVVGSLLVRDRGARPELARRADCRSRFGLDASRCGSRHSWACSPCRWPRGSCVARAALLPAPEQTRLPAPRPAQMNPSSAAPRASAKPINLTPSIAARASVASAPETPRTSRISSRVDHVARLGLHRLARDWRRSGQPLPADLSSSRGSRANAPRCAMAAGADALDVDRDAGDQRDTRLVVSPDVSMPFTCGFSALRCRARVGGGWSDERMTWSRVTSSRTSRADCWCRR